MKRNYRVYSPSKRVVCFTVTVVVIVILITLPPFNLQRKYYCSSYALQNLEIDQMTILQFKEYIHFPNVTSCEFQQDFGGSKILK